MSGIAGIRSGAGPADPALLARMSASLAHRGPDGDGQWIDGAAGLAHRLLPTTPESLHEKQPVADDRGDCWIVWDGRLDNRAELGAALPSGLWVAGGEPSDPELALLAYRAWGEAAFARLLGDFALAIWERKERRLICARDVVGAKPLYYHATPARFAFASEARALLADPGLSARPDDAMIADFLLMDFRDPAATFFAGVRQLPAGHVLTVGDSGIAIRRYRALEAEPGRAVAGDQDWLDGFRELFVEAVRCRLRALGPIALLLSGGIDSTSVAAVASSLVGGTGLTAFTLLWDEFLQEEWDAIETLRRERALDVQLLSPEVAGRRLTKFELSLQHGEGLHHDWFVTTPLVTRPAAARGCRAVLTGFGADELIASGETGDLADALRALDVRRFVRGLRRMAASYRVSAAAVAAGLVWAESPPRAQWMVRRATGRAVPRWIAPGFARRAGLSSRGVAVEPSRFPTRAQDASYQAVARPALAFGLACMDQQASAASLECRHPFLDRRLVELVLSLPGPVRVAAGYRKMFVQRALEPVSPVPLRPAETIEMAIPPMAAATWKTADAARLEEILFRPNALVFEYVDRREAERIRARYLAGDERWRTLLWQFAKLELWLSEFAGGAGLRGQGA